jgi:hypothetical protein
VFIPHDNTVSASTSWYQKFDYDELNRLQRVKEYNSANTQLWQQEYDSIAGAIGKCIKQIPISEIDAVTTQSD